MGDVIASTEAAIKQLRIALSQQNRQQVNRVVLTLERSLLDGQDYLSIWDERLLAEVVRLLSGCYGEESGHRLEGLHQHLIAVRAIHDRLYAILDAEIDLDELLFLHLDTWPELLDGPVECRFDNVAKGELHQARSSDDTEESLKDFLGAYLENLRSQGLGDLADILEPPSVSALNGYGRAHHWTVQGLFVTPGGGGEVRGLRICPQARLGASEKGQMNCLNRISPDMETTANQALACARTLWPHTWPYDFTWDIEGGEVVFTGDSIGLALTIGIVGEVEPFDIDAYTAFTGHVDWATGEVGRAECLREKLEAAKELGIRRVFIPRENGDETRDIVEIQIIPVGSIEEAREWLRSRSYEHVDTPLERLANVRIRELEIELKAQGVKKVRLDQREEYCKRVVFTDHRDEVLVDVFHGRRGLKPIVQRKHTALAQVVQGAVNRVFGTKPLKDELSPTERSRSQYVVSDPTDQKKVQAYVSGLGDAILEPEKNCVYRAKIVRGYQTVFVRQFSSGKLTLDGPPGSLFEDVDGSIQAVLGVSDLGSGSDEHEARLRSQIEAVEAVQLGEQWIGTDESGKGDYYGPLVGSAVLVDGRTAKLLDELGVRDSKKLSDKRVRELAVQIRQVCGKRAVVVPIPPERYNELYRQFQAEGKSLNTLLAWAHARALEDILSEFPQRQITVLIDKFADESYIQSKLLEKGRQTDLNLVQLPKAEANIAVAAASVLARAQFLQWLKRLSRQYGVDLPKGASDPRIVQVGKQIVTNLGEDGLAKVAKLHFKTTKKVLASD